MKKILFTFLIMAAVCMTAQNYTPVVNYNSNTTPANGVKIKTNLPFTNSTQMPTITIEGYNYNEAQTIGLSLVYYIIGNNFVNYSMSSFGGYTPEVKLANENGKVVIFINDKKYFNRFTVRAYAKGLLEEHIWFSNWEVTDEALTGANTVIVPYVNEFAGNTKLGQMTVGGIATFNNTIKSNGRIDASELNATSFVLNNNSPYSIMRIGKEAHDNIIADNSPEKHYGGGFFFRVNGPDNNYIDTMLLSENGNVGIGINPKNKLDVNGTIHAREVKVDLTGWADYVFKTDYDLPSLEFVEKHIKEKGHLPSVPSEQEVLEKGINLGDNQRLLLQKIEELTLYSIEQNKKINSLEVENKQIKSLLDRVEKLEQSASVK